MQTIGAKTKLVLHVVVNLAGNALIVSALPSFLPSSYVAAIFLVFNLAQVAYAFMDPSYAVHLIQTGQLSVPPKPEQ